MGVLLAGLGQCDGNTGQEDVNYATIMSPGRYQGIQFEGRLQSDWSIPGCVVLAAPGHNFTSLLTTQHQCLHSRLSSFLQWQWWSDSDSTRHAARAGVGVTPGCQGQAAAENSTASTD